MDKLDKRELKSLSEGYFDSFNDLAGSNLWNNGLNLEGFEDGYKVDIIGSGLFLVGTKQNSYFAFVYQSID